MLNEMLAYAGGCYLAVLAMSGVGYLLTKDADFIIGPAVFTVMYTVVGSGFFCAWLARK